MLIIKSGVYQILNLVNNKKYIGSSQNLSRRLADHKRLLKRSIHCNKHLQSSFNKYGADNFSFEVVEYCSIEQLICKEQFWADSFNLNELYNKREIVQSNRGFKFSEESKNKLKGRVQSEEQREKKSQAMKINGNPGGIKKGEVRGKETQFKKGRTTWNKGTTGLMINHWAIGKKGMGILKPNSGSFKSKIQFQIASPNGILYKGQSVKKFTKAMKSISDTSLYGLINGQFKSCKGWHLPIENHEYKEVILFN